MGGNCPDRQNSGERDEGGPPTLCLDEPGSEWQENGARKSGDESYGGKCAGPLLLEPDRHNGERRLVQYRGHDEPDASPEQIKPGDAVCSRPGQYKQRADARAGRHEQPWSMLVEPASDWDSTDARDHERP